MSEEKTGLEMLEGLLADLKRQKTYRDFGIDKKFKEERYEISYESAEFLMKALQKVFDSGVFGFPDLDNGIYGDGILQDKDTRDFLLVKKLAGEQHKAREWKKYWYKNSSKEKVVENFFEAFGLNLYKIKLRTKFNTIIQAVSACIRKDAYLREKEKRDFWEETKHLNPKLTEAGCISYIAEDPSKAEERFWGEKEADLDERTLQKRRQRDRKSLLEILESVPSDGDCFKIFSIEEDIKALKNPKNGRPALQNLSTKKINFDFTGY